MPTDNHSGHCVDVPYGWELFSKTEAPTKKVPDIAWAVEPGLDGYGKTPAPGTPLPSRPLTAKGPLSSLGTVVLLL